MTVWRNQYIFIDSCSCRPLSPSTSTGVRVWVHDCPTTLWVCSLETMPFDSPSMKPAPLHDCNDNSWPRNYSQQRKLGAENFPVHRLETTTKLVAAAAESTTPSEENNFPYERLFSNNCTKPIEAMDVLPKERGPQSCIWRMTQKLNHQNNLANQLRSGIIKRDWNEGLGTSI